MAILSEVGFIVYRVEDGTFAVEKMKNARPGDYDVIIMDVQMPIMDGYEATRQIRALENVAKPIDIPKLMKTLKEILYKS